MANHGGDLFASERSSLKIDRTLFYRQRAVPELVDNYQYAMFYANGNKVYNLKGFEIVEAPMNIRQLRLNPAGHSIATIISNGKRSTVVTYDINAQKHRLAQVKAFVNPQDMEYTSDSRLLVVADGRSLHFLDSRSMEPAGEIELPIVSFKLAASPKGLMAVTGDGKIIIVSTETNRIVRTIDSADSIVDILFEPTGSLLGVLTDRGILRIYDGHSFNHLYDRDVPLEASSLSFHPDGKYVAVNHHGNRIKFMNLMEPSDSISLSDAEGHVQNARFIRDERGEEYIAYNTLYSLKYIQLSGFIPNYTKLLEDELNARMAAWSKMLPFETEEEYALRVNEETKARQKKLFANEIATGLAGDLIRRADVTLGNYNPESGQLALSLSGMNDVFLVVPQDEAVNFGSASDLEFRNAVYALTPNDSFEVIYVEVFNPHTGKSYTFDNLARQKLDFLVTDDSFISLDLIRQSSREDARLQTIKEEVLSKAKVNSLLSDHTKIDVSADIISDYDEDGKRINNYRVDFTYTVEPDFSATEDFAPGKYDISDSHAAESMLNIVAKAFEDEFKQYLQPGKKVMVNLTGSADAIPILRLIGYDGRYGEFESEVCRIDGNLSSVSVYAKEGIRTNEQLAFIRAQAVKDNLLKGVPGLTDMDVSYNYNIEVSEEKGGAFRRINVSFIFVDVF
ncbi:MAG: WD40 repeat domain-containing protein [Muribaculaceae bacterium]|nr:WD40 repeat domain-containing protein [Muribaculaceae bacterium]